MIHISFYQIFILSKIFCFHSLKIILQGYGDKWDKALSLVILGKTKKKNAFDSIPSIPVYYAFLLFRSCLWLNDFPQAFLAINFTTGTFG